MNQSNKSNESNESSEYRVLVTHDLYELLKGHASAQGRYSDPIQYSRHFCKSLLLVQVLVTNNSSRVGEQVVSILTCGVAAYLVKLR
jgi:hypothetical protein